MISGLPSKEELEMIRDSVLIPIMLDYVKARKREIEHSQLSLKALYVKSTEALLKRIHADLTRVKKELKQHDIKVVQDDRYDYALHFKFYCRGIEDEFKIMKELVKSEMGIRLGKYVDELSKELLSLK